MNQGFIKVAACCPPIRVADCEYNVDKMIEAMQAAQQQGVKLLVYPELSITGYTCGDLFFQASLQQAALSGLEKLCQASQVCDILLVVGFPLCYQHKLFNCAAVVQRGKVLGVVPKTNLPNYNEFYELRQFEPALPEVIRLEKGVLKDVLFGTQLLFQCDEMASFVLGVELCEDLWVPVSPSASHAAAGATIIANLSASSELMGKSGYRHSLVGSHSSKILSAYIYSDASPDESTTDVVFSGNNLIYENGELLAQTQPFAGGMAVAEIDVDRLIAERQRLNTFPTAPSGSHTRVLFSIQPEETSLTRHISPTPFYPEDKEELALCCQQAYLIQANGLRKRIEHTGARHLILGVSGGLDSTLALLASVRGLEKSGLPASALMAITMPGFGTTSQTKGNAEKLCALLGTSFTQVDITSSVRQHFKDIQHDETRLDVVFENAQARMRTLILMDYANKLGGIVVGTGDLSELALGWATYSGDQMSMYSINGSIPKTLVRKMVEHEAETRPELREVLLDILATPISPELLPSNQDAISQVTEDIVGPYELHDFFLYHLLRWGFSPSKIAKMAGEAFSGRYSREVILHWLRIFYQRFISQQFKRNCMPDGPKVTVASLSPRGDFRMPSDASASVWLREIAALS